jgi:hypothetical protein
MKMRIWVFVIFIISHFTAKAQIPAEIFVGEKRATIDIMFFKYFKNSKEENSRWLFFHRNRASVDMRSQLNRQNVLFGFTEALSYNHPSLKGLAPVAVLSILNGGITPKAGLQYVQLRPSFTLFSWAVASLESETVLDYFLLLRFTPGISAKTKAFLQFESVNAWATANTSPNAFTLRSRIGLKHYYFQWGVGLDQSWNGKNDYVSTTNPGIFVRYEF